MPAAEHGPRRSPSCLWTTQGYRSADLVRNDPFLRNRPKMLLLSALGPEQVAALCRSGSVAVLRPETARRLGFREEAAPGVPTLGRLREALTETCGPGLRKVR